MAKEKADAIKGPASYFPAIEKKYCRPVSEWIALIHTMPDKKHMDLVKFLKENHEIGHGHANALVAYALAKKK